MSEMIQLICQIYHRFQKGPILFFWRSFVPNQRHLHIHTGLAAFIGKFLGASVFFSNSFDIPRTTFYSVPLVALRLVGDILAALATYEVSVCSVSSTYVVGILLDLVANPGIFIPFASIAFNSVHEPVASTGFWQSWEQRRKIIQ